jgi:two-component system, response regulator YesN
MDWRVAKLKAYIDNHAGGVDCSLGRICQKLGLGISAAYAARLFKRNTGMGVREYAKMKRLEIAAERLTSTNVPVKLIAADLGYKTTLDFIRLFTKQHHLSPAKFRLADRQI